MTAKDLLPRSLSPRLLTLELYFCNETCQASRAQSNFADPERVAARKRLTSGKPPPATFPAQKTVGRAPHEFRPGPKFLAFLARQKTGSSENGLAAQKDRIFI